MSKVYYIYSRLWEYERSIQDLDTLADEWFTTLDDIKLHIDTLKVINNRYILTDTTLNTKIQDIVKMQEDELLNDLGDSMEVDEDETLQLESELNNYKKKVHELLLSVDQKDKMNQTLSNQVKNQTVQLDDIRSKLDTSQVKVNEYKEEVDSLQRSVKLYQDEIGSLQKIIRQVYQSLTGISDYNESDGVKQESKLTQNTKLTQKPTPKKQTLVSDAETVQPMMDEAVKTAVKGGVNWVQLVKDPRFPYINDIKKREVWHSSDLAKKISTMNFIITETDLEYIVQSVFKNLGYEKERRNPKIFTPVEVILIVTALHTKSDKEYVGLSKLEYAVKYLYKDWYAHRSDIKQALGVAT